MLVCLVETLRAHVDRRITLTHRYQKEKTPR